MDNQEQKEEGYKELCEVCEQRFSEEEGSENPHRCQDCYEEWGDLWPDEL